MWTFQSKFFLNSKANFFFPLYSWDVVHIVFNNIFLRQLTNFKMLYQNGTTCENYNHSVLLFCIFIYLFIFFVFIRMTAVALVISKKTVLYMQHNVEIQIWVSMFNQVLQSLVGHFMQRVIEVKILINLCRLTIDYSFKPVFFVRDKYPKKQFL